LEAARRRRNLTALVGAQQLGGTMTTSNHNQPAIAAPDGEVRQEWMLDDPLEPPEQELLDHALAGTRLGLAGDGPVDHQAMTEWGPARTVRGAVLRYLLVEPQWAVHSKGVQLRGMRISGRLDLESATVRCPLLFEDCYFDSPEPVVLDYATVPRIVLARCRVAGGLTAGLLVVTKELDLTGSVFEGAVRLAGADITGQLNCCDAQFTGKDGGNPAALHNRLMAMLGWTEPYYKDVASLLLRLALNAPGEDGPVRSSAQLMARMDPELLVRLYEHDPDRLREARSLVGRDQARAVKGAVGRFANFFAATAGGFDAGPAGWSFEDVDFAYLRAPYLAGREDADACMRLLLEDFAHYATLRKPRKGEDATLVFDEFSAIAGGREAAIQLVERVRDAGCALYLSAQSADGLGDEAQQRRLVGACSGGLLVHPMPDPETLLKAAGVVKVVEQTWRLDTAGPTGNSSARIGERPRIEVTAVQQAREGEAWYIARGRFEHLMVARTTISDGYRARAHALVALARAWRPQEVLPGARTWIEAQAAAQGTLAGLRGHLAIEPPPDSLGTDLPPEPSRPAPAVDEEELAAVAGGAEAFAFDVGGLAGARGADDQPRAVLHGPGDDDQAVFVGPAEVAVDLDAEGDGAEVVIAHGRGPPYGRFHPLGGLVLLLLDLGGVDGLPAASQVEGGGEQPDRDGQGELRPQERPGAG